MYFCMSLFVRAYFDLVREICAKKYWPLAYQLPLLSWGVHVFYVFVLWSMSQIPHIYWVGMIWIYIKINRNFRYHRTSDANEDNPSSEGIMGNHVVEEVMSELE